MNEEATQTVHGFSGMLADTVERFGINAPGLLAQLICFLIVAAVLYRFVFRKVLARIDERQRLITETAANAEKLQDELKKARAAREKVLGDARIEAERILSETRTLAAELLEKEKVDVAAKAAEMFARIQDDAELYREKLRTEMRNEMAELAIHAASAIIGRTLRAEEHDALIRDAVQQIGT